jgi:hypothetical protein
MEIVEVGCWQCGARCPLPTRFVGNLWFLWHKTWCPVQGEESEAMVRQMLRWRDGR